MFVLEHRERSRYLMNPNPVADNQSTSGLAPTDVGTFARPQSDLRIQIAARRRQVGSPQPAHWRCPSYRDRDITNDKALDLPLGPGDRTPEDNSMVSVVPLFRKNTKEKV